MAMPGIDKVRDRHKVAKTKAQQADILLCAAIKQIADAHSKRQPDGLTFEERDQIFKLSQSLVMHEREVSRLAEQILFMEET
jgi:hypothetical protein